MRARLKSLLAVGPILLALAPNASSAPKKVPDPTKSTYDLVLVGNSSCQDMGNAYHVVPRDVGNIPLAGTTVSLHFVGSVARPGSQQEQGTTFSCPDLIISRIAGGNGEAVFHASIAGFDNARSVQVRANGVLLTTVPVRSTDLDGDGATDVGDLNLFRQRFLYDPKAPETDFDQNGITNSSDLVKIRVEMLTHAYSAPCP